MLASVSGAVLAGGRSTRMGLDKARLVLGGRSLAQRAADALRHVCAQVIVVGTGAPELARCRTVPDALPLRCSLTGLYTALVTAPCPLVLVAPCDVPFVEAALLRLLLQAWRPGLLSVVPLGPHGEEPLVALHHRDLAPRLRDCLDAGALRIASALDRSRLAHLPWASLRRLGVPPEAFWNLNTPEDLEQARRLMEETRGPTVQNSDPDDQ
jgi:molybdopterin-guanine dinucleotide biosynthesis protein A